MRICIISREYPPETGWGGIATFARHLSQGLKELGHEVVVVSLSTGAAKTEVTDGITVHRVSTETNSTRYTDSAFHLSAMALCMPYSRYVLQTSTALWKKFIELHAEKPFDVVDTPELLAEGLYPAATKVAPLVIRLYTPHSKFIAEKLHNVKPSFDHEFVAALERVAMLSADALTSPSDDLSEFVARDLHYPQTDIAIVRNPIDPEEFSPEGHKALADDGKVDNDPSKEIRILFVGRLEERKGIHYLIDAVPEVLEACPNARFVIIGDDTNNGAGQKSVLAELKQKIAQHGCEHALTFIKRIPLKELPAYYRSADISCVPSVYDNSPYTCLEAMSCGRPVIGTSGGGTAEYIGTQEPGKECGIVIPPRDTKALASALIRLCQSADERKRIGENARKRVIEQFHRREIARQTVELYELAHKRFMTNKSNSLYQKDVNFALADAQTILISADKMIYDTLYAHSLGFRIRHWGRLVMKRPRLAAAKTLAVFARTSFKLFGISTGPLAAWLANYERYIEHKQFPHINFVGGEGEETSPLQDPFADLFMVVYDENDGTLANANIAKERELLELSKR
jgi:glycosyltransferase involved in cell wall biosynthesis